LEKMMKIPMRERKNIFRQVLPILLISIPHQIESVKPKQTKLEVEGSLRLRIEAKTFPFSLKSP